ncbi:hypothetical protein ElyMa_003701800 [Elysia marginata]|uniref:Uncharacterized protein n=1 Tax=Elysia marginata TaxID=1093978 RepID=A0AAV4F1N4_9GAST|nr:hypothetical protein ElyMa_003701800 [Elysia marginata]
MTLMSTTKTLTKCPAVATNDDDDNNGNDDEDEDHDEDQQQRYDETMRIMHTTGLCSYGEAAEIIKHVLQDCLNSRTFWHANWSS